MKSIFVFVCILVVVFNAQILFAQTNPTIKKNEKVEIENKSSFDKFYERLKIGYFGAYSGSSLGEWDHRALDVHGTKDKSYVQNLFNQLSFNYNFGAKLGFIINPRWTTNLASTKGYSEGSRGLLAIEDTLAGFQGVIFTSEDKKFNWWLRAALRLPTSPGSRDADITYQPDFANNLSYDFDKTWQVGAFIVYRHWVFENKYNFDRYRIYTAPFVQYAMDDTARIQVWWETLADNRTEIKNGKKVSLLKEELQDVFVGYSKDITPQFNIFPYIGFMLNTNYAYDRPADAMYLAAWISYQIK